MNIMVKEFKFEDCGTTIEGTFFYDEDIIDKEYAKKIILEHGYKLDNRIFKKDAPCFFLPKAQADMLRHSWVKEKVDSAVKEALANEEEKAL